MDELEVKTYTLPFIKRETKKVLQLVKKGVIIAFPNDNKTYYIMSDDVLNDLLKSANMEIQDG